MTFLEFLSLMRKHLKVLVVGAVAGLLIGGAVAVVRYNPKGSYTGSATIYVSSVSDDADTEGTADDTKRNLQSGQMLAYDVAQLASSDRVKKDVAEKLDMSEDELNKYKITAGSTGNTTPSCLVPISVTGDDPQKSADIANAIADDVTNVAKDVLQVPSMRDLSISVVQEAEPDEEAGGEGPSITKYGAVGLLAGLFVAVCGVALWFTLDTRVVSGEELENLTELPVVGSFREIKG